MNIEAFLPIAGPVLGILVGTLATYFIQRRREFEERQRQQLESFYERLLIYLNATQDAFVNQCKIRNRLVEILREKTWPKREYETYDNLFAELYPTMNEEELHLFQFIRGITENTLFKYNSLVVQLLDEYPQFYNDLPELRQLHDHLNLWLDKYNSVFRDKENMCLVYVGVEDKKPFPKEIDRIIKAKIEKLQKRQNISNTEDELGEELLKKKEGIEDINVGELLRPTIILPENLEDYKIEIVTGPIINDKTETKKTSRRKKRR